MISTTKFHTKFISISIELSNRLRLKPLHVNVLKSMGLKELTWNKVQKSLTRNGVPLNILELTRANHALELMSLTCRLKGTVILIGPTYNMSKCLCKSIGLLRPITCTLLVWTNTRKILLHKVTRVLIVNTLSDNTEELLLIKSVIHAQKNPKVLPRTNNRHKPKITVKFIRVILSNPKQTLESLITRTLSTLNLFSLLTIAKVCLTSNHTKIKRKFESHFRILSPKLSLLLPYSSNVTTSCSTSMCKLVNKSSSSTCIWKCSILSKCSSCTHLILLNKRVLFHTQKIFKC